MREHTVLATYVLQLIGPDREFVPAQRIPGGLLGEAEENISDQLPEGYYVKISDWDKEETPHE